ncbi:stealth conserved region 3 domain-containing protein [Roseovarius sp. M141]|uniref:stealth conserved region 3 domain-containing protein n=1 Tax=Roseovarius sp. M141 TaxID=2583806 RepID=UPI0020CB768B|nr:stealth conserved region 3 domain-containing protein [Roseovarius sp. M141]MCQ0090534.1 hypothetical protein [Roseovarius sp. M141]
MTKIDAVIMWVDGEDEIFRRQYANYAGMVPKAARRHEVAGRHRNSGELVYCLRGIHAHMPWIDRIHIVTSGQIPDGLNFNDPKLNLVIHSDIFPDLSVLPTFNSFAIDSCLHRIPGLSEKFVRFSDDFLVINPVVPEVLLGADGQGHFYFGHILPNVIDADETKTNHIRTLAFNRYVLGSTGRLAVHATQHAPQLRDVTVCHQIEKSFTNDFAHTRASRFRTDRDISMLFFYPHYVSNEKALPRDGEQRYKDASCTYSSWKDVRQVQVGSDKQNWRERIANAKSDGAYFLNVNDAMGNAPNPKDMVDFQSLMRITLPDCAPWETPDGFSVHYPALVEAER